MPPKDRAFRKELLLVKGDALRMQLRLEQRLIKKRLAGAGAVFSVIELLRALLPGATHADGKPGWRRWLMTALKSTPLLLKLWRQGGA